MYSLGDQQMYMYCLKISQMLMYLNSLIRSRGAKSVHGVSTWGDFTWASAVG